MNSGIFLYDNDSEKASLGSMIINSSAITVGLDMLSERDFSQPSHRIIFRTIKDMVRDGNKIDELTVIERLAETGKLEEAGGRTKILSLADSTPTAHNIKGYAELVRDRAIRRSITSAVEDITLEVYNISDIDELVEFSEKRLFSIRDKYRNTLSKFYSSKELANDLWNYLTGESEDHRVPYPWPTLEERTGGMSYGELIVIGGYSGDGKSVAASEMCLTAAAAGKKVGFFSLEMPAEQVERRFVSMVGIPVQDIRNKSLSKDQMEIAKQRLGWLKDLPYDVYAGSTTVEQIKAHQLRQDYDVIFVDHLHRMATERHELERNVRGLKNLALDTNCVVACLAQLSRREGFPRPSNAQLRESAAVEFEADTVFFVYRKRDGSSMRQNESELVVSKMRDGESDYIINLDFKPNSLKFIEPSSSFVKVVNG